jgi:Tol biopolymer transport system component
MQRAGIRYAISSDGSYAAYFDHEGVASPQKQATRIVVEPLKGSGQVRQFDAAPTVARGVPLKWIPGGTTITYADAREGTAEIWGQTLAGGAPRQITDLSGGLITSFDWSPDGRRLVLSRGMRSYALLLLEIGHAGTGSRPTR